MNNLIKFYDKERIMVAKSVFILISGRAGVGKSTLAKYIFASLVGKKYNTVTRSFADGVKDCAIHSFYWDGKKNDRGRKLLQDIGNTGRSYNKNLWVQHVILSVLDAEHAQFIIVDDWRFKNELQHIRSKEIFQTVTIRVEAPEREILKDTEFYKDISETSLPSFDVSKGLYDIHVFNPEVQTLNEYAKSAEQLVNMMLSS